MLECPRCPIPLTWCFLTPSLPLTSWPRLLSIKNPRNVAHIPLGDPVLKEAHMQIFSCTNISAETSDQMAAFLGLAVQNWLFKIQQTVTELCDHLPVPEIPDHCTEAAGYTGQGFSSILHMWDIPSASGVSTKKRGNDDENQILKFRVLEERAGLHGSRAIAPGIPDPSVERWHFALTTINVCHPQLERTKIPLRSLIALSSLKSKEEQNFLFCTTCAHPLSSLSSQKCSLKLEMPKEMITMPSTSQLKCCSEPQMEDVPG